MWIDRFLLNSRLYVSTNCHFTTKHWDPKIVLKLTSRLNILMKYCQNYENFISRLLDPFFSKKKIIVMRFVDHESMYYVCI
jgi:hypothetical protein